MFALHWFLSAELLSFVFELQKLERIPARSRTLAMNLALGKLYYHAGLKRNAISAYKDALKQNPYALEAIQVSSEAWLTIHYHALLPHIQCGSLRRPLSPVFSPRTHARPALRWHVGI